MSIQVRNLTYTYSEGHPEEQVALKDVNLDIYDGEFVSIIGHTGSGKSTLVQHFNGLLKPNEGQIVIDGCDITENSLEMLDIRRKVGLVFQYPEYQLFEETVEKDVAFGPKNMGFSEDEVRMRVREALDLVGLSYEEFKDLSPFELSGGQKRLVAVAGVLAMKPKVLILDEPTAGLDPVAHEEILELARSIHTGTPDSIIIMVTHNMDDVYKMSDKVLVMDRGSLVLCGTPEEVFSKGDVLSDIGLDVPPVTALMNRIRESGVNIRSDVFDVKSAADVLYEYLKDKEIKA